MMWTRLLGVAALLLTTPPLTAQDANEGGLVRLYVDCDVQGCRDSDFLRREVAFVSWVRDRQDSDVHVLVTSQTTGGGGSQYSLIFIGQADFEGQDQTLLHATPGDATEDELRSGLVEKLKVGLVRYVQGTAVVDRLRVDFDDPTAGLPVGVSAGDVPGGPSTETQSAVNDPWDFWVFRFNGNGFVNGQATSKFSNFFGTARADRTTEAWKLSFGGSFSQNVQEFQIPDTLGGFETVKETLEDWGVGSAVVRSIGGQWAVGVRANAGSSTFENQEFRWTIKPGIEYDFFPYSESSRRSLTLQYLVGPKHFEYQDPTIFGRTAETRLQESLTGRLALVEPWGRWSTSVTAENYLDDTSKYNITVVGNFNIRLFRGFSIRVSGNYSWIRDQLFIAARGATEEEILLRQRQLGTSYRYFTSFGIEYRFGSIFNDIVNPRFGGSGGNGLFSF